jgi:ornithine carbamoyltransferase
MHCLPADRDHEPTAEVIERLGSMVSDQPQTICTRAAAYWARPVARARYDSMYEMCSL